MTSWGWDHVERIEPLTFQHAEEQDHHLLLEVEQLPEELQLLGVLGQLLLEVGKDMEEANHGVPQPAVG